MTWLALVFGTTDGMMWALTVAMVLLSLAGIWYLSRRPAGSTFGVFPPTLPGIFVTANVFVMLLPSVFFVGLASQEVRYRYLFAVALAPVLASLGAVAAGLAFPTTRLVGFWHQRLAPSPGDTRRLQTTAVAFLVISLAIVGWYISTAPYVPFVGLLRGRREQSAAEVRFAIYQAGDFVIFTYALANRFLLPVGLLWSYFQARRLQSRGWTWLFAAWLVLTLMVALMSFERQNPVAVFAAVGLATIASARRVQWVRLAVIAFALVVIGGIVSITQYNGTIDSASLSRSVGTFGVYRVVVDPAFMTWALLEQYRADPPLLGTTFRFVKLLGINYESGLTAIGYLSDLWINFHALGLFVGPFIIGAFLRVLEETAFRVRTRAREIVHVLYCLATAWLMYTNLIATMTVVVLVLGIGLIWFCDRGRTRTLQPAI